MAMLYMLCLWRGYRPIGTKGHNFLFVLSIHHRFSCSTAQVRYHWRRFAFQTGDRRYMQNLLTERECVAKFRDKLGGKFSLRTLRRWRERGEGPPWGKQGRYVLYSETGIDDWLASIIRPAVRGRAA
jgi:hypothetical protein